MNINVNRIIAEVEAGLEDDLTVRQMQRVKKIVSDCIEAEMLRQRDRIEVVDYLDSFLAAKRTEGLSPRTLKIYQGCIREMLEFVMKPVPEINANDIRLFLGHKQENGVSNITIDNYRRFFSTFFKYLEDEDLIIRSPMRKIKHVKSLKEVKEPFTGEEIVLLREEAAKDTRNLAIFDLLLSTGVRVSELVGINRNDVNFDKRTIKVLGKGNKERIVYFDSQTSVTLKRYLRTRNDNDQALFIGKNRKSRMTFSGIELLIRNIGEACGIPNVHPHRFRRTLATRAIDKGMPIEQVQVLLGHENIETTLIYARVNQENVAHSHRKYFS